MEKEENDRMKKIIEMGIELTQGRCLECNEPLHIISSQEDSVIDDFRVCYSNGCARKNIIVLR